MTMTMFLMLIMIMQIIMSDNLKKGDIIRFTSLPLHYAVYIGDGYIVHYNKRDDEKLSIMKEPLEEYIKRYFKSIHYIVYSY